MCACTLTGKTTAFGGAVALSSVAGTLNQTVGGMDATSSSAGYWLVASDGGVFAFGDAGFFGSTGAIRLNQPIVGIAASADRQAATGSSHADGGVFAFGDAGFSRLDRRHPLNQPIVGMAATPTRHGYWLVAADGGVFAFGDACSTARPARSGSTSRSSPSCGDRHGQGLLATRRGRRHVHIWRRPLCGLGGLLTPVELKESVCAGVGIRADGPAAPQLGTRSG